MGTLFLTLFAIAASVALDQTINRFQGKRNNTEKLSPDDIISLVNSMTNEARQKGEDVMERLNTKLSNIQFPLGMSSSVKDFITNARNKLSNTVQDTSKQISNVEKKITTIQERANNLSNQTEDYRRMFGEQKLNSIKDDAQKAIEAMNKIEQGVETHV